MTYKIKELDLSFNNITGTLPSSLKFRMSARVSLKSNLIHGLVPRHFSEELSLDLSSNFLSGSLPNEDSWRNLFYLSISGNNITGTIPSAFCKLRSFTLLDLSNNQLHGRIPNCGGIFPPLRADFSNSKLSGPLPNSFCSSPYVNQILIFHSNRLTGVLPPSLQRCSYLIRLDLGANNLVGSIPSWIGGSMPILVMLQLGHNMFSGNIPWQLSNLGSLHILDLSSNRLRGPIPSSFGNFSAMKLKEDANMGNPTHAKPIVATTKGRVYVFTNSWMHKNLKLMDLSDNSLIGNIPEEITGLVGLHGLNLSHNLLTGEITTKIGGLTELQSLDLSKNKLSGAIPQSLSILTSLEALDLSYNNLSGRIPTGNQMQTFNESSFAGNPDLCGVQLNITCPGDKPKPPTTLEIGNEDHDEVWLYIITACGFLLGIWTVYLILLFKRNWRHRYFKAIDEVHDKLSLFLMLRWSRLKKKLWIGGYIGA